MTSRDKPVTAPAPTSRAAARPRFTLRVLAFTAVAFGLLTVVSGGVALFGGEPVREVVGDAVPLVLWFNFVAGALYVIAGVGLLSGKAWATSLSVLIAALTLAVLVYFGVHVLRGGAHEARTVYALLFRSGFWIVIAAMALRRR